MQLITLFQKIYDLTAGAPVNWTVFWSIMILLYINIILYLMDLYAMVKKQTPEETLLIILVPGALTIMGSMLYAVCLQIPAIAILEKAWTETVSPGLWTELLCLAGLYALLWCLTWRFWRKNQQKRLKIVLWIFSYIPDFLMAVLFVAVGVTGLIGGADLLIFAGRLTANLGYNLFLYLFLYGAASLIFKMALIFLAGLTRLCTVRISHFPYQEGRNPTASFLLYGSLCQNARLRGALALCIPMLCFAAWLAVEMDTFDLKVVFPVTLFMTCILSLLLALRPLADNMARFAEWGDQKQVLSMICREYFLEEPLVKNRSFTVTRHFLADERGMIEVFAFEALEKVSDWASDPKKGWVRKLTFLDGGCCTICKDDAGADEIFRYTAQYWETLRLSRREDEKQQIHAASKDGLYYMLFYSVAMAVIMLLFMMYQMM